jgi:Calcineurin-like phosphoesterase
LFIAQVIVVLTLSKQSTDLLDGSAIADDDKFNGTIGSVMNVTYPVQDLVSNVSLNFLLLGDWGKGGLTGSYGSRRALFGSGESAAYSNDDTQNEPNAGENQGNDYTTHNGDGNNNKNKNGSNGGGANGGNGQKKTKELNQPKVAKAMISYVETISVKPSFVVALGDNFYNNGVKSSTDANFNYLWKDVYFQNSSNLYIPWYPVFGNHDYGSGSTGIVAQLQRRQDHSVLFKEISYSTWSWWRLRVFFVYRYNYISTQ